jgi:hypothetical protein
LPTKSLREKNKTKLDSGTVRTKEKKETGKTKQ